MSNRAGEERPFRAFAGKQWIPGLQGVTTR